MASEIKPIELQFSPISACRNCGKMDVKLSQCGRCHFERYCGQSCQIAHWPKHKKVCQLQAERSSGDVDKDQSKLIGAGNQIQKLSSENSSQTLKSKPHEKVAKAPKFPSSDREKLIWNQQALQLQDLQNKGNRFLQENFFEQAEEAFQKQLTIAHDLGYPPMIAQAYYNVGITHNDQGKHTEAVTFLKEAALFIQKISIVIYKQDMHISLKFNIFTALGKAFDRLGKYDEAEKNNRLALPFGFVAHLQVKI